jgi:hypothetical protein
VRILVPHRVAGEQARAYNRAVFGARRKSQLNKLRRTIVKKTLFVAALALLASVALFAQDFSRSNTVPTYLTGIGHNAARRATPYEEPAGLAKIYSNLGSKTDAYDGTDGWLVAGPNSPLGEQQWIGYGFTPTRNHTATQLRVAFFSYSGLGNGGNDFNFGIWSDSSGVPGTELSGRDKKIGQSQGCCKLNKVNIKALKLKKGTPYWVVISTDKNGTDAIGAWDFVYNDASGTQAYNLGSGWSTEDVQVAAFAVYGTK